ncbi:MAG: hypothetical protein NT041_01845 [Candidatus Vogelbacteria bacterium]|nr:hypothetical protein [Candidatus Vogelbacteria bacterium]
MKIAKLPSGQDPAEVIKANPESWPKIIAGAKHYIDFMIDALQEEGKKGLELNLAVNNFVLPYVKALDKKMEQAHFVAKLSGLLHISEEAIWSDLQKIKIAESEATNTMLAPARSSEALGEGGSRQKLIEEKILGLYFLLIGKDKKVEAEKDLVELWGEEIFNNKIKGAEVDRERLALMAELWYDAESDLAVELADLVNNWQEEKLKAELKQAFDEVQTAEQNKDEVKLETSLKKCQELSVAINKLKK